MSDECSDALSEPRSEQGGEKARAFRESVHKYLRLWQAVITQIRDWEAEFNVGSANELRATLADEDLGPDEESRRREIVQQWEHLQRRIQIVGFVIHELDF